MVSVPCFFWKLSASSFRFKIIKETGMFDLLHCKHKLHIAFVRFVNESEVSQIPFSFCRFFGQDVTLKSVFALNLAASGDGKPLFCTGISFHFWHCTIYLVD